MAPKGHVSEDTWVQISRSLDEVDEAVRNGINKLDYFNKDTQRFSNLTEMVFAVFSTYFSGIPPDRRENVRVNSSVFAFKTICQYHLLTVL